MLARVWAYICVSLCGACERVRPFVCVCGGGVRVWCICVRVRERVCLCLYVCVGCLCVGACVWMREWCECVYVSVCGRVCVGAWV